MTQTVIVSRHPATIEWLKNRLGKDTPVYESASEDFVRGKVVYGNLPMSLACITEEYHAVEFERVPPRGVELSAEDLSWYGIRIVRYTVIRSNVPEKDKQYTEAKLKTENRQLKKDNEQLRRGLQQLVGVTKNATARIKNALLDEVRIELEARSVLTNKIKMAEEILERVKEGEE